VFDESRTSKLLALIVVESIASLNVAVMLLFAFTPVAALTDAARRARQRR
jgi:hypothetical protein